MNSSDSLHMGRILNGIVRLYIGLNYYYKTGKLEYPVPLLKQGTGYFVAYTDFRTKVSSVVNLINQVVKGFNMSQITDVTCFFH